MNKNFLWAASVFYLIMAFVGGQVVIFAADTEGTSSALSKLKAEMKKALVVEFEKAKVKKPALFADVNISELAESFASEGIKGMDKDAVKELPEDRFKAISSGWAVEVVASVMEQLDVEERKSAAKKNREEKRETKKRAVPPRWVWTPKEWKSVERLMNKLKERKGYEQLVLNSSHTDYVKNVVFPDRTFYYYETDSYAVWSDVGKRFTAELKAYTERFVKTFKDIFPVDPRGRVQSRLVVVVFNEREQYKKVLNDPCGEWSRGVFTPLMPVRGWPQFTVYSYFYDKGNTDYDEYAMSYDANGFPIENKKKKEEDANRKGASASTPPIFSNFPYSIIQHEATHAMLRKYAGTSSYIYRRGEWVDTIPIFFNEACATFFENYDMHISKSKNMKRTAVLCNDRWLIRRDLEKNNDQPYNLRTAFALVNDGSGPGTWAADNGGIGTAMNYATAQTFGHFLLTRKSGRSLFRKIMARIYRARSALEEDEYKKVQKDWNKHIRNVILTAAEEDGGKVSVHELKVDE